MLTKKKIFIKIMLTNKKNKLTRGVFMSNISSKNLVRASMFTAILVVMSYISIPLPFSPVPITGQGIGVMLTGLILDPVSAFLAFFTYLLLGAIGLPVFAGGSAGLSVLVGPTGGYLLGYLIGTTLLSMLKGKLKISISLYIKTFVFGAGIVYLIGFYWLSKVTGMDLSKAFMVGVVPYIIGDVVKAIISVPLAVTIYNRLKVSILDFAN